MIAAAVLLLTAALPQRMARTGYQINVSCFPPKGNLEKALRSIDDRRQTIINLGVGTVFLSGLPPISQWSDGLTARAKALADDLHQNDIELGLLQSSPTASDWNTAQKAGFDLIAAGHPFQPSKPADAGRILLQSAAGLSIDQAANSATDAKSSLTALLADKDPQYSAWKQWFTTGSRVWTATSPPTAGLPSLGPSLSGGLNQIESALTMMFIATPGVDVIAGDETGLGVEAVESAGPWDAPGQNTVLRSFLQNLIQYRRTRQSMSQGDLNVEVAASDHHVIAVIRSYRFETTGAFFNTDDVPHQILFPSGVFGFGPIYDLVTESNLNVRGAMLQLSISPHSFRLIGTPRDF